MQKSLTLTIPNQSRFVPLALHFVEEAAQLAKIEAKERAELLHAARELIDNAVHHAYPKGMEGAVDIEVHYLHNGLRLSIHDMGMPFDFDAYMASERQGGLKRLHAYVDELTFANLGHEGKSFTIFKHHPIDLGAIEFHPYSDLEDESPASLKPASIVIRDYQCGDEEAISRLIYSNYSYSYFKPIFYDPKKVREMNEKGELASVVAETKEGKIVGHFALVKIPHANIAEIGVAVVHPDYKGQGIMNAMLDRIQQRAVELGFYAIFGEALMMHPYSQRANLRHGFGESALLLGLVPNTVSLTDPNAVRTEKRSAVLIGYKMLKGEKKRPIHLPAHYRDIVKTIYKNCGLEPTKPAPAVAEQSDIYTELSQFTQTGTLMIETIGPGFAKKMRHYLHTLYKKHVDMIYADINLMRCRRIDDAVALLKEEGFVFSGVLFYRRGEADYLRMQMPNSDNVETEAIVCHSDFCHGLLGLINDELQSL